jgi:hypothetical protein
MRGVGWEEALVAAARVPPVLPEEGDARVEGVAGSPSPSLFAFQCSMLLKKASEKNSL